MTVQCRMRPSLAIMLMSVAGCATTLDPARGIYDHSQDSIRRAKRNADDRVADEAQADILRAFIKLKGNLQESSSAALQRRIDMAEIFRGQAPQFSSQELGEIVGRLMDEANAADSHRLLDFRADIVDRSNPDGMDPIRRAVLDRELRERGIIMERAR